MKEKARSIGDAYTCPRSKVLSIGSRRVSSVEHVAALADAKLTGSATFQKIPRRLIRDLTLPSLNSCEVVSQGVPDPVGRNVYVARACRTLFGREREAFCNE